MAASGFHAAPRSVHVRALRQHDDGPLGWWLTNAIAAEWLP